MMMTDQSLIEKVTTNVWLTLVGRLAIIACSLMFPFVGTMISDIARSQISIQQKVEVWQTKTDAQIESVKVQLASLVTGRYTIDDARRDLQLRDFQIQSLNLKIQELEQKLIAATARKK